ncbi:MAG: VOC family protein [Nakamurella sp.]
MTRLTPYLTFPGTARQALTFYQEVFGGVLVLNTLADFGRDDGPADAIAHGMLSGPVELFGSDAVGDEPTARLDGVRLALLGTADPGTLETWFTGLCDGGADVDPLQRRPWGAHDGQVTDRFGVRWLVGYED